MARRILIVIDMQNDFIDGALGSAEAQAAVPVVAARLRAYAPEDIFATRDTHSEDYPTTREGRFLPVVHCVKGTPGWEIHPALKALIPEEHIFDKPTFGSEALTAAVRDMYKAEDGALSVELAGVCTDICVVSNALLLKAALPEMDIYVDPACCAGVTPLKHEAALETMRSCQIIVGEPA